MIGQSTSVRRADTDNKSGHAFRRNAAEHEFSVRQRPVPEIGAEIINDE